MDETCEKLRYRTRRIARRAAKRVGDSGLRPYRCLSCIGAPWHLGHLADTIRQGGASRKEIYRR